MVIKCDWCSAALHLVLSRMNSTDRQAGRIISNSAQSCHPKIKIKTLSLILSLFSPSFPFSFEISCTMTMKKILLYCNNTKNSKVDLGMYIEAIKQDVRLTLFLLIVHQAKMI